ncbi:MAG TPA: fused MFS/spermidine synthase [Candidatus Saccharimonadales bacterium]|nr:fused MFS/spermidine synthase [Candidatus Saccharimonadales bacterium]
MSFFNRLSKFIGEYEAVAFISGFALMAYELVASRILAPAIGSSIYVWTSVIGIMIAALAIGYAAGGWLADKRVATQDIAWLLIASAVAMAGTLLFYEPILFIIGSFIQDQRLQGIVAAITLFMPASFLLGMISPYLARLRVKSVTTTGRSVAGLSALNSIGGIAGTFCAGFIFFSLIGSRETLILLVVLLLCASWLVAPGHRVQWRAAVTASLAITIVLQFASQAHARTIATIDTPTAHYNVQETRYNGRPVRVLTTDPYSYQSGIYTDGSKDIVFDYAKRIAELTNAAPRKDKIAILGGGAFTLPEALGKAYPQSQIDVVEIDPQLPEISKKYFNYDQPPNVRAIGQDARVFLREAAANQYDLIIVDAYGSDTSIPFALTTRQYAAELKRVAKPDATMVINIAAGTAKSCEPFLTSVMGSYAAAFANLQLFPANHEYKGERQNLIAVASNERLDWVQPFGLFMSIDLAKAVPLTDNHAPTEPLAQQCRK